MTGQRSYWRTDQMGVVQSHRPPDGRKVQDIVIGG